MNKFIAALIMPLILFSFSRVLAQNKSTAEEDDAKRDTKIINILSIDGKSRQVKIIPDYANHVLKMICLKDIITIDDFWGVPPEITLLNKSFVEIKYAIRGGSNLGLGNTLILCVNNSHLFEAMHVLKYVNSESGDEKQRYNINLIVTGSSAGNYKLNVHVRDDLNSKRYPEINYIYNNESVLAFDAKQNVFYSVKENLYNHFITTKNKTKQKVAGNFPMIILGKETYYFINGRWYNAEPGAQLFEFK